MVNPEIGAKDTTMNKNRDPVCLSENKNVSSFYIKIYILFSCVHE